MPFQQSLSSIFLPSTSIYASIDQTPPSRSTPPPPNQVIYSREQDALEAQDQDELDIDDIPEIDPFSSVTPSVLSPIRSTNPPLPQPHAPIQEEDPFYDDPDHTMPRSRIQSEGETNPTSPSFSTSSRVIGSKSLMGLLGGTTYRSQDAYRSTREEEEEETEEGNEEGSMREADEQDHHSNYRDDTDGEAERRQR